MVRKRINKVKKIFSNALLLPLVMTVGHKSAVASEVVGTLESKEMGERQQALPAEQAGLTVVSECLYEGKTCRLVTNINNSFIESHSSDLHLNPQVYLKLNNWAIAPFGVYGLEVDGLIVGLHRITPIYQNGYLLALVQTDIFGKYRASGYGTLLRKLTAIEVGKIVGKFVRIKSASGEGEELTKFPLSYLFSINEWDYGKNGASTNSSLKAGYGIACISEGGLVNMLFPKNESLWGEERTKNLMSASRILGGWAEHHREAIPFLFKILNDLDLTQKTEVETLNSLTSFMDNRFGSGPDYQRTFDEYINGMSKNNLELLSKMTKGITSAEVVQKIPPDLLRIRGTLSEAVKDRLSQRLDRFK